MRCAPVGQSIRESRLVPNDIDAISIDISISISINADTDSNVTHPPRRSRPRRSFSMNTYIQDRNIAACPSACALIVPVYRIPLQAFNQN